MARRFRAVVLAALMYAVGVSPVAGAQAATATINGTVVDQTSALIGGAAIRLVNLETGALRTATTGAQGGFVVALLPPRHVSSEGRP